MKRKRKIYTDAFKQSLVREIQAGGSIEALARKHQLSPSILYRWRKQEPHAPVVARPKAATKTRQVTTHDHYTFAARTAVTRGEVRVLIDALATALAAERARLAEATDALAPLLGVPASPRVVKAS